MKTYNDICSWVWLADCDLTTKKDRCVLYSGKDLNLLVHSGQMAAIVTGPAGFSRIEATPGGKLLEQAINEAIHAGTLKSEEIEPLWREHASKKFVLSAEGNLTAYVEYAKIEKTFLQVELPTFFETEKATSMNHVPKEHLKLVYDETLRITGREERALMETRNLVVNGYRLDLKVEHSIKRLRELERTWDREWMEPENERTPSPEILRKENQQAKSEAFAVKDKITFTENLTTLGIAKGMNAVVTEMQKDSVAVRLENGDRLRIPQELLDGIKLTERSKDVEAQNDSARIHAAREAQERLEREQREQQRQRHKL